MLDIGYRNRLYYIYSQHIGDISMTKLDQQVVANIINKHYNQAVSTDVAFTHDNTDYYIVSFNSYPQSKQVAFYLNTDKKAKKNNNKGQFFAKFDENGIVTDVFDLYVF